MNDFKNATIDTIYQVLQKAGNLQKFEIYGKDETNQWRGLIQFGTEFNEMCEIYFGGKNPPLYKIMERLEIILKIGVFILYYRGVYIHYQDDRGLEYMSNEDFFADGITPTREMFGERPKRKN